MIRIIIYRYTGIALIAIVFSACAPSVNLKNENKSVPESYNNLKDTTNTATINWKDYFTDPNLIALIDIALQKNQELSIIMQEIAISKNEVREKKGEYLPFIGIGGGAGVDKVGRYTRSGALEATTDIEPEEDFPEPLPDFMLGAHASWELDIWKKLRNAKKATMYKYLSSVEGKNFMVTNLVAEIANSYYELLALDNQLEILKQNIEIQQRALKVVKLQKQAAEVTELAVQKFEAEVLKNQSFQFEIHQMIIETENKINFLLGRFPQPVERNATNFDVLVPNVVYAGIPSQLLENRPDIRQAELELAASKMDVKVAKANFYPSIGINASIGYQAFKPGYLFTTPESMLYSLVGDLMVPLINRNAIKAMYLNAGAKQIQAVYDYERTVLSAYIEVANQVANIGNLEKSYELKEKQVDVLNRSIKVSTVLFKSARADYMEVLMTQRDAIEAKMELIETKKEQMSAVVNMYRALGGGWN